MVVPSYIGPYVYILFSSPVFLSLALLGLFSSILVSRYFLFPSFTAAAGKPATSVAEVACTTMDGGLEEDASSERSAAFIVMDGSGAEYHQVGVGGQVRSAEELSQSEQTNSEYYGVSGTARSPTRDSGEAAQSASQPRASPRTGIPSGTPRSEITSQSSPRSSTPQHTGSVSDSQLLYFTSVQDEAIPAGFLCEFESLMVGNEDDAARQSRQSFRDDVQSAIWLHEKSKEQNLKRREEKTAADLFVQATTFQKPSCEDLGRWPELETRRRKAREE